MIRYWWQMNTQSLTTYTGQYQREWFKFVRRNDEIAIAYANLRIRNLT
jgi:hypothetical protein